MQAIKKQLNILCVNNGFGNTASSINLLANKALNLSYLKTDTTSQNHVPQTLKQLNEDYSTSGKTNEIIIEWL
jgi:hypothetical protein